MTRLTGRGRGSSIGRVSQRGRGRGRGGGRSIVDVTTPLINKETTQLVDGDDPHNPSSPERDVDDPILQVKDVDGRSSSGLIELDPDTMWFTKSKVSRCITSCLQKYYNAPWRNWTETDQSTKDQWFKLFKRSCTWRPELEEAVRINFEVKGAKRLKDLAHWVTAKKQGVRPEWMSETVHKQLMSRQEEKDFKKKSAQAKLNKRGGSSGTIINPGHCQGSISATEVAEKLAKKAQGVLPFAADVYKKTHSRVDMDEDVLCCQKSRNIMADYNKRVHDYKQKGIAKDLNEVFFEVVGGRKKGLIPGLGTAGDIYYKKSTSRGDKSSSVYTPSLLSQLSTQLQQSQKVGEQMAMFEQQRADFEKQRAEWEKQRLELKREWEKERLQVQKEREQERKMLYDAIELMKEQVMQYSQAKYGNTTSQPRDPRDPSSGGAGASCAT